MLVIEGDIIYDAYGPNTRLDRIKHYPLELSENVIYVCPVFSYLNMLRTTNWSIKPKNGQFIYLKK